ncbi:MAG: DsbE family thiol:disulfide interchange protein [Acetobacter orientalis]|uniref:Cytochrome c biogenesis protein n=1 Tax=Acetobacter orientalis TaxID=146474 RepID=A0A2Z5ZLW1_9PROT|nr:DsbE family thiol:disulfide interchange protein [Acetobacter orientalis]MCP1216027.1 DsbE family thiol:disulfide interchange protein [Acetobacter orientalis]MCP1217813.1 DsbE family thiol:disulfide interchange protein [Acetobacter orientalis]MCP1221562.1 DsbE family thiol:disulfide interchange protein [Acetobacter orientalis]BBC81610.1 cytochrome c biogenesis protein [Acetobacter orientalis]
MSTQDPNKPSLTRRRVMMGVPLAGAAVLGVGFWKMLSGMQQGSFNPHDINAPVLNRPVPDFTLPDQTPGQGFATQDLKALTKPILVNFFASWCIPCLAEMPTLMALKDDLELWGIAYKDRPENAAKFLQHSGNPFTRLGSDRDGRVGIEWGISGVPETFLIGPGGIIRWHSATPLEVETIRQTLIPLLAKLKTP